jgi:hypothetical protein
VNSRVHAACHGHAAHGCKVMVMRRANGAMCAGTAISLRRMVAVIVDAGDRPLSVVGESCAACSAAGFTRCV